MLNATFEMFIFHYIMEYVGNLSNPCLLCEQQKGEFIIVGQDYCMCALWLYYERKHFAGNFSVITNNEYL